MILTRKIGTGIAAIVILLSLLLVTERPLPLAADATVALPSASLHQPTPQEVRGEYWNAGTAADPKRRAVLLREMQEHGLNTVVIDLKDDDGTPVLSSLDSVLAELRDAGIYRIARIAVMRDSAFALQHPAAALRDAAGGLWRDRIGSLWVDPAHPDVAAYALALGREAYARGFDEIQFDYVRFPSDGALGSIRYPVYDGKKAKTEIMQDFFTSVGGALRREGIPVSFDLFGMTFWTADDFGIGQLLSDALASADFVSPMTYPSHYPAGFDGLKNPALYPYEIVKRTLDRGVSRFGLDPRRVRPWIQDFDIGVAYGSKEVAAQIQAARDAGASGWMLWNARNVYTSMTYN